MRKIERNYRKNPHTARWLMTFHAAAQGLPSEIEDDNRAEYELAAGDGAPVDLLDTVPVEHVADRRTPAQIELMAKLHMELAELDAEVCEKAVEYTTRMTLAGAWTPGREGNASEWISRMIAKIKELKAAARKVAPPAPEVDDGRYAVEVDGVLKFFRVRNGRKAGVVFLDVQASDEWHPIQWPRYRKNVIARIAQNPQEASFRYADELGRCYRCGRTLTDEASRKARMGPDCRSK